MSPDFTAAEYEQICESYNDNRRIFIQVVVFLAVANVSVIGYAVAEKVYSIFIFGGLFMWILFRANVRISYMVLVVLLRGLKLEKQMGVTGLMHYIAAGIKGKPPFLQVVTDGGLFSTTNDEIVVVAALQQQFRGLSMKYDVPFALSRALSYAIIFLTIVQVAIGVWGIVVEW